MENLKSDCIFCKIIKGELPSAKIYEDEYVLVFKDIQPQAEVHMIMIPKTHIASLNEITEDFCEYLIKIHLGIQKSAESAGVYDKGYRIISNCGKGAGQTVDHLHYHIIAGSGLNEKIT